MMKLTSEIINKLPKAELHCHLDGSLRIKTIIELAEIQGVELPSKNEDDLLKILSIGPSEKSLEDYIKKFDITLSVLQTPKSLERAAFELAMDCHDDGVRYLEVRYSPILHTKKGMQLSETVDSVKKGLAQAFDECGILTGIIICGIRHISPDHSLELANLSAVTASSTILAVVTELLVRCVLLTVSLDGIPISTSCPWYTAQNVSPLAGAELNTIFEPDTLNPFVPVSSGCCITPLIATKSCPDLAGVTAILPDVRAKDVNDPLKLLDMSSTI